MYNHAPKNYKCPFCKIAKGDQRERVIYRDEKITAFISSHWWPNNPGHVLIIPNEHVENIYDLSDNLSDCMHRFEKEVAMALKEVYRCDGVSSRQHNESAGNQDVWHYHLHIFPRYKNDKLYQKHEEKTPAEPQKIKEYAEKLRNYFKEQL